MTLQEAEGQVSSEGCPSVDEFSKLSLSDFVVCRGLTSSFDWTLVSLHSTHPHVENLAEKEKLARNKMLGKMIAVKHLGGRNSFCHHT